MSTRSSRGGLPAPLRQPRDDLFQPAEAARRLGQLGLARQHGRGGGAVALRQVEACRAQLGQRSEEARIAPRRLWVMHVFIIQRPSDYALRP